MSHLAITPHHPRHFAARPAPARLDGPDHGHEFFRPTSAVWWLYCLMVPLGFGGAILLWARKFQAAEVSLVSVGWVFLLTFAFFAWFILTWADRYRARRPWVLALASLYGASAPVWLALHANHHLVDLTLNLLPAGIGAEWGPAVAGPTTEEWGKMLGTLIIMLIASRTLRRPIHGLLVGAFVGLGLEVIENISYSATSAIGDANSDYKAALAVGLVRGSLGFASHWLYAGIAGVGVAFLLGRTVRKRHLLLRILAFVGFFAIAWGLHFAWNAPSPEGFEIALVPVKVVATLVVFMFVLRFVRVGERAWLGQADAALRHDPAARVALSDDPAVTSAIGTRKERRRGLKAARKAGGWKNWWQVRRARRRYLDALQAWGRTGTGVDELPLGSVAPRLGAAGALHDIRRDVRRAGRGAPLPSGDG